VAQNALLAQLVHTSPGLVITTAQAATPAPIQMQLGRTIARSAQTTRCRQSKAQILVTAYVKLATPQTLTANNVLRVLLVHSSKTQEQVNAKTVMSIPGRPIHRL
jgi:hypothetical protein